jgi:formylglycine-generating enzyme required for sulfatase activity
MLLKKIRIYFLVVITVCLISVAGTGLSEAENNLKTHTNSLGMEFVLIPAGTFMMGADKNFEEAFEDELPRHLVRITEPFYIGKFEVTQSQWVEVMGENPSRIKGRNNPVEQISWFDAKEFSKRLNQKEGHSRYRLPTEAEWEYAARAGSTEAYPFGDDVSKLGEYAWYVQNSNDTTHPVGQKLPNAWGLYDILGNVWELVEDWYSAKYYAISPTEDPLNTITAENRLKRGGVYFFSATSFRVALRGQTNPTEKSRFNGLRLVLSVQ